MKNTIQLRILTLLNVFYFICCIGFLLDNLPTFDITNQWLKSIIYLGFLISTPLVLIGNLLHQLYFRTKIIRALILIFSLVVICFILHVGVIKILFLSTIWKTEQKFYRYHHGIEEQYAFQLQDIGALGFNKRVVKVIYESSYFLISEKATIHAINKEE